MNCSMKDFVDLEFGYNDKETLLNKVLLYICKNDNMEEQQLNPQLNIEITEEMSEGEYANLAIITHSHAEFVIDFISVMPNAPKSRVKSRIIFTPMHAKRFMKAMVENIQRFEASHGVIQDLEQIEIPMNFGGPTAQA
jgi:ribonuclease BN (tRNA processing enzyme)